jgi:hypothetical protein
MIRAEVSILTTKISLNANCSVVLTKAGAEQYNAVWTQFGSKPKVPGDVYKAQLWSLFQDFGHMMRIGVLPDDLPFKDLEITVHA